jgi:signal transduction histidine kinase/ActR/RegA family two-component response regulator
MDNPSGPRVHFSNSSALDVLLNISKNVVGTFDLQKILIETVHGASALFEWGTAAIYLMEDRNYARLYATYPELPSDFPNELRIIKIGDHPHLAQAIRTAQPVLLPDTEKCVLSEGEKKAINERQLRTLYYVPLVSEEDVLGAFIVGSSNKMAVVTDENAKLTTSLANFAALAIKNARLFEEKNQYTTELEQTIVQRDAAEKERKKLQEDLFQVQKLDAIGQLAGGVAHDFNNMLAVILGRTQLALLQMQPTDPHYKTFLEIQSAAEHSVNLTRQLLGFARKQTAAPKVLDLNRTIFSIHKLLRRLISEDIDLIFQPAEELWPVLFDPDQIGQILTNLCVNARDAIQGVGKIIIETKKAEFDSAYCSNYPDYIPGEYTCLSVSDTGCGMDKATQNHIFEPFFTTKGKNKGTGLGLSTVYGIVKQNNAFINTYSEPGQGSAFRIYIPRYLGEIETSSIVEPFESIPPDSKMVLLVEDEPKLLDISKAVLEEIGCKVLAANTTAEAIRYAEDDSLAIDLLITDVVMPEMNGRELALCIMKIRPSIRCLFMSGYTANIIAHKGVLDMDINFIQKPFSLQAMAAKIREVMNQKPKQLQIGT